MATSGPQRFLITLIGLLTLLGGACHDGGTDPGTAAPGTDQIDDSSVGQVFFVAPNGLDTNPGTIAQPWRTVRRGITALRPGDRLVLRGGTYFESELWIAGSGTAEAPITIANHPGETPVIDGGFSAFRNQGNNHWEVYKERKAIYRSTATFPGAGFVEGYLSQSEGGFHLLPYERFAPLSSDNEDYQISPPDYYCGPGLFWNPGDERIYIRLVYGRYQEALLSGPVPANPDPRQNQLFLFPEGHVLDFRAGAAHWVVEGLQLRYRSTPLHIREGCHDLTFRNCEVLGGRYHIVVRTGTHHLKFDGLRIPDRFPPWVARSDVKRPEPGRPARQMQGAGIFFDGRTEHVEIGNSTFTGLFDGINAAETPVKMRVHHCSFSTIRDDVFEIGSAGYGIEFDHNVITNACVGISWTGSGAPPPGYVGTKYIHHNVIDTSTPQLYGRRDPTKTLPEEWHGPNRDGMATGRAFGTHTLSAITGPDPWRIYHNTIIGRIDVDGDGAGVCYTFPAADRAFPHSVFNNIFVQVDSTFITRHARVSDGSQVFDGNLYYRPVAPANGILMDDYHNGSSLRSFTSLQQFRSSPYWTATTAFYPNGWESSGVEGNPGLGPAYHPSLQGPAATGAVNLNGTGWPGLANETFRGALPPR